jgi:hypothetical protein
MEKYIAERKTARFWAAVVTFILTYGILIARYDLWGLGLGWLPAAVAGFIAGWFFYRAWWLGYFIAFVAYVLTGLT